MTVISALFPYMILPALFLIVCTALILIPKMKYRRAGFYGLLAFFASFFLGAYTIFQSRGSTSGIGFIFLPLIALLPGITGFILGKVNAAFLRKNKNNDPAGLLKTALIILSLLLVAPYVAQTYALMNVFTKNKASDVKAAEHKKLLTQNFRKIKRLVSENPGREKQLLESLAKDTRDRTLLIPIAKSNFASPELLDRLSKSTDLGIVLTVVKNRNTTVETLVWVHKNHSYPSYFYSTLALNPKTPPEILHELYEKRDQNRGIPLGLARNVNVPKEILEKLLSVRDKYLMRDILKRPDLTCEQLEKVNETIGAIEDGRPDWLNDLSNQKTKTCRS